MRCDRPVILGSQALVRGSQSAGEVPAYLEHGRDDHGKHAHGKAQDIEEGDGGEGLLSIQNVIAIHQDVD